MVKAGRVVWTAIIAVFVVGIMVVVADVKMDASLYAGTKSCRMCHKKESTGNQYQKWLDGPHSKAYKTLASKKAKKIARKEGVSDPQKDAKCLKCHSTAYHLGDKPVTEKIAVEEGVTCESCHGPGKNYKPKSVMQDRDACIENGMIYPATKSCKNCHNNESATWDPNRYTNKKGEKVGFDAEKAYNKIQHPNPNLHQ